MLKTCPLLFAKHRQPHPLKKYTHELRGLISRATIKNIEIARQDRLLQYLLAPFKKYFHELRELTFRAAIKNSLLARQDGLLQVFYWRYGDGPYVALPLPCRRVISERRNTLLNRN